MTLWKRLLDGAKDVLAQSAEADPIVYPAGSPTWSALDLKRFHDSLEPFEAAVAAGLGQIMTLRLYARLPVSQRQETMDRVSGLVAASFGFSPPAPVVVDETNRQASWYAQGLIVLNHRALRDLRQALHTALHESFHCLQKKTIDQWRRGEIPPGDPRLAMAPVWAYNFAHYIQPVPGRIELYLRQPLEYHAERFAHAVIARLPWLTDTAAPPEGPSAATRPGRDIYDMMYD